MKDIKTLAVFLITLFPFLLQAQGVWIERAEWLNARAEAGGLTFGWGEGTYGKVFRLRDTTRDNRNTFASYDASQIPPGDVWVVLPDMPLTPAPARPGRGSCIAYFKPWDLQRYVLGLKGRSSLLFYAYNVRQNNWTRLPDIPGPVNVDSGGAICFGGLHPGPWGTTEGYFYALKGNATREFYRFRYNCGSPPPQSQPLQNHYWERLADAPLPVGWGGALTYAKGPGNSLFVYALTGMGDNHLFRYDPLTNQWRWEPGGPGEQVKKGGALTTWLGPGNSQYIFVVAGGSTDRYAMYDAIAGNWTFLDPDAPRSVKQGTGLAAGKVNTLSGALNVVWAYFGDWLDNHFYYWAWLTEEGGAQSSWNSRININEKGKLKIYNSLGKLIGNFPAKDYPNLNRTLPAGIYFYTNKTANNTERGKFVIIR